MSGAEAPWEQPSSPCPYCGVMIHYSEHHRCATGSTRVPSESLYPGTVPTTAALMRLNAARRPASRKRRPDDRKEVG